MKVSFKIVILLIIVLFSKCDKEKKEKENIIENKKKIKLKKEKEKEILKPWDSLNSQNTEAFLLEYGKQNPETKVIIKTKFGNIKLRLYNDVPSS